MLLSASGLADYREVAEKMSPELGERWRRFDFARKRSIL
jgi:hypothetical protein